MKIKKKYLITILVVCILVSVSTIVFVLVPKYKEYKERKEYEERLKNATILVELKGNLDVSFYSEVKVSDFLVSINGELVDDFLIDTKTIGEKEVVFHYINNEENLKIPYRFKVNVVDDVKPVIWLGGSYSVTTEYNGDLLEDIVCADNYDDNPKCEILGEYDTSKVGSYNLTFKATDSSNNVTEKAFTLYVKEPVISSEKPNTSKPTYTYFQDVIQEYKTNKTKIGIDVSSWQGDIDFDAVKAAGVEFAFVRIGSTKGINGEYFLDNKFEQNIEGFHRVGIPVGVYFYTYASTREAALRDARWVLKQLEDKKIDLPVVYDWESWSFYNAFHQSFYSTSMNAKVFLDEVSKAGYEGMLYSSKNYLEKVWFDIGYDTWLAHYTSQTNYEGEYRYWQFCSNGRVDGIKGNVDLDIMYA